MQSLQLWENSGILHGYTFWVEMWGKREKGKTESSGNTGGVLCPMVLGSDLFRNAISY